MVNKFIPVSTQEVLARGWKELDIIIVSGDAYVDHPSFGPALIARWLEKHGYRVGIIPQPYWDSIDDFTRLGKPRLFFAVTSGNMDSLVCNRTSLNKPRKSDTYSPGAKPYLRPDRAVIVYSNKIKQAYKDVPIVIGGIESSLRRLAHYDYWSDSVRRSIIFDARADILVYGMGERPVLEIAKRLESGSSDLDGIESTAVIQSDCPVNAEILPSYEDVSSDKKIYLKAHNQFVSYFLKRPEHPIVQQHQNRFLVHNPPGSPLSTAEMDSIYDIAYTRKWHPMYDNLGGVPALEPVRFSITSHRGCFGGCSFCALFFHQGHIIQTRSKESIIREINILREDKLFKGYISDIGGPTANMYGLGCPHHASGTHCGKRDCLGKEPCPALNRDHAKYLGLLKEASKVPGIKKIFISTGIRYDLFPETEAEKILREICKNHLSGQMKVAPEHISDNVLKYMKKPSKEKYLWFLNLFDKVNKQLGLKQFVIPYFITAHPGCTDEDMQELASFLRKLRFIPDQIQDFLPTPMTTSTCMYYTGLDPRTEDRIYVAREYKDKMRQREILHGHREIPSRKPDTKPREKNPAPRYHKKK